MDKVSEHACFGGVQGIYRHPSTVCHCDMTFGLFVPAQAKHRRVPLLWYLSGLTCTDENFVQKAGAQRVAAELGIAIVAPDTSPRGEGVPGDPDGAWDFGIGAGFYVDATEAPWAKHYRMHEYVVNELPSVVEAAIPFSGRRGVSGHSMGGHGALVAALRNPGRYHSLSAFAPIVAPSQVPWGQKAFSRYLGDHHRAWDEHDACGLVRRRPFAGPILVDQGLDDKFLAVQLQPERFETACAEAGQTLSLRRHAGYDHGYYFVASFIEDHLRHHAAQLA